MRKHNRKDFVSSGVDTHSTPISISKRVSGILPNTTAPLSTNSRQWRGNRLEKTFSLTIASHITIFPKVELSRKRVSLLLEQSIIRVCSEGFSLEDYFLFEWMFNYLVGTSSLHNVNGNKMSTAVYAAHLILLSYRGESNLLYERTTIREDLAIWVKENLGTPSSRKYQGRNFLYQIEKFLWVKIEDVEVVFERVSNSNRYSSYCKGYGESGRSVRKQKTRYSYELDRDDSEPNPEEFYSYGCAIHYQEDLFYLEQIILEEKKA